MFHCFIKERPITSHRCFLNFPPITPITKTILLIYKQNVPLIQLSHLTFFRGFFFHPFEVPIFSSCPTRSKIGKDFPSASFIVQLELSECFLHSTFLSSVNQNLHPQRCTICQSVELCQTQRRFILSPKISVSVPFQDRMSP